MALSMSRICVDVHCSRYYVHLLEEAMCKLIAEYVSLELEMEAGVDCHGSKFEVFFFTFPMTCPPFSVYITKALFHLKKSNASLYGYWRCSLMNPA